jgi:hypothetical protein
MSNQLRSILVTRLGKVNFEADPQGAPFRGPCERPDHMES